MEIQINAWSKRKGHQRLRKIWHIVLSFLLGVAITTVVHVILSNQRVRTTAEAVCTVFGRDEGICKVRQRAVEKGLLLDDADCKLSLVDLRAIIKGGGK